MLRSALGIALLAAGCLPAQPGSTMMMASAAGSPPSKNAMLLSDVQTLTLRAGKKTTHRRVAAVPQLKCVSTPRALCDLHRIETMRCTNEGAGYDDQDIQWSCSASLPDELQLDSTDVICEGYAGSNDPYVLKGSCGVEYRLALTDRGRAKFPHLAPGGGSRFRASSDPSAWIFGIIFVAVLGWILYSACTAAQSNNRRLGQRRPRGPGGGGGGGWGPGWGPGGGGGGGGGGGFNDPPPPYPGSKQPPQGEGWRPGFWSGVLGGAAAGYMAGNRNDDYYNRRNYGGTGWGRSRFGGGGGWGASSSRSNSGSSSTSSSRHESTGFGGTSRR